MGRVSSDSEGRGAAAWGTAPCPLAPTAWRRAYGGAPALWRLAAAAGRPALSLADLDAGLWRHLPWDELPSDLFRRLRKQLAWFVVPSGIEMVPRGVDRDRLLALPLRTRTSNCLRRLLNDRGIGAGPLEVALSGQELLAVRGAGRMVLIDLLCVLEGAQEVGSLRAACAASADARDAAEASSRAGTNASSGPAGFQRSDREPFDALLAVAGEVLEAKTLQDAVACDLAGLAAASGLADELADIDLAAVTGGRSLTRELLDGLGDLRSELDPRWSLILERRLFRRKPETLEAIGQVLGVTRERVRQVETRLKARVKDLSGRRPRVLAAALATRLDPVLPTRLLDRELAGLFEGATHTDAALACRIIRSSLGYRERDGIALNPLAVEVVEALRGRARQLSDDAGLFDEEALQADLPDPSWQAHWPLLVELCGFHRIDGLLGLRNTKKAGVKAAVLRIGRVATKLEISERCGLTVQRTTSYLSSLKGVVRADRTHWGLAEWIEDAYDGVAGEILQRIDEDGGVTRVERLFEELPRLFGTSEATIRAYLGAAQFVVEGGMVRRADLADLRMRPLEDVVDGLDEQGRPFLLFEVEERHFRGYSLAGVVPEVASALDCEPNGSTRVAVRHPAGVPPLSVNWSLTALNGVSIGYLFEPLRRLEVRPGDRVRLVLCAPDGVEFERHDALHDGADQPGKVTAKTLLERMKSRRRVL